jgi:hypothetical protein
MRDPSRSIPCRRGAVVPLVAIAIVVLLSFVALAVDGGLIYFATSQMQRAADASALAGASGLMDGGSVARQRSIESAGRNQVIGHAVSSQELDVVIGNWSGADRLFTETPDEGVDDVLPNAVHVTGDRPNIGLFFAPVMGTSVTHVRRGAVAVSGAGNCAGVWGLEGVTTDGDILTDSYDPEAGHYGPGNMRPHGDICSCGDIIVNGSGNIHGDTIYGEGHAFIPYGTSYEVTGVIDDHYCETPSFDVDYADAAINNDNATIGRTFRGRDPFNGSHWDLYVSGNDHLTLNGGTYYFTSALLEGQAYLEILGPTTIYVDGGPATFTGGGVINTTQEAGDLIIYANGDTVNLSGNSAFYGGVVAPQSTVILEGTTDFFGTILARVLDIDGDATIHVDEALVYELFGIEAIAPVLVQ